MKKILLNVNFNVRIEKRHLRLSSKMAFSVRIRAKPDEEVGVRLSSAWWSEYVSLAEAAIFEYAFRLGARLAMEVQTDEE